MRHEKNKYQQIVADFVNYPRRSTKRVASDNGASESYTNRVKRDLNIGGYEYLTDQDGSVIPESVIHLDSTCASVRAQIEAKKSHSSVKKAKQPELEPEPEFDFDFEPEIEPVVEPASEQSFDWSMLAGFIVGALVATLAVTYVLQG